MSASGGCVRRIASATGLMIGNITGKSRWRLGGKRIGHITGETGTGLHRRDGSDLLTSGLKFRMRQ